MVLVRGKVSAKDREGNIGEELKIMVDDAREITAEQAQGYQSTGRKVKTPTARKAAAMTAGKKAATKSEASTPKRLYVRLDDSSNQELLLALKQAIDEQHGTTEVVLVLGPASDKQIIKLPVGITVDEVALGKLGGLVGAENIKLQ